MLPYFPFEQDSYAMTLGVRALRPDESLIEVDEAHYVSELARKAAMLTANPRARFQAWPGTDRTMTISPSSISPVSTKPAER